MTAVGPPAAACAHASPSRGPGSAQRRADSGDEVPSCDADAVRVFAGGVDGDDQVLARVDGVCAGVQERKTPIVSGGASAGTPRANGPGLWCAVVQAARPNTTIQAMMRFMAFFLVADALALSRPSSVLAE